jgi:tetratricopeptide (TPR) repeat protein
MPIRRINLLVRCARHLAWSGLAGLLLGAHAQVPTAPPAAGAPLAPQVTAADHVRDADALVLQGKASAAMEALRAALALDASLVPERKRLAAMLAKAGRINEAKAEYDVLHRVAPDPSTYLFLLRARRDAGALVDAARLAQEAGNAFPSDAGIALLAAEVLLQLRDPVAALAHLARIPADASSDGVRGRAAEAAGQWALAYTAYSRLLQSGSAPTAQAGRQRALRYAVALDRRLIFAPSGWETIPGKSALRHSTQGFEVTIETRSQADDALAVRQAITTRLPANLFNGLSKETGDSIAAKAAEHKEGATGHFNMSALVMQAAATSIDASLRHMALTVERIASPPSIYAAAVANPGSVGGDRLDPVYALLRSDTGLVFVVARIDAQRARELLLSVASAEVVQP